MVIHWTKQCFWSVLDWPEIITYICVCILYGIDYQVYFCVALLRHLQQEIIYQHSSRNLLPFLKVCLNLKIEYENFLILFSAIKFEDFQCEMQLIICYH
jgi:hypothetical protein